MPDTATLHGALGSVYESLDDLRDKIGENVLIKHLQEGIPNLREVAKLSDIDDCQDDLDPCDIAKEVYDDLECIKDCLAPLLNEADNCLAQLVGPVWEELTNLCANMAREMCD